MQKGYRFLEHTADIMVSAYGPSLEDAIEQAAYAMFEVLGAEKGEKHAKSFEIEEKADTRDELVVNFLSAVLAEAEINEILPSKVEIGKLTQNPFEIKAKIEGTKERPKDHIKAVTYHQFKIEKKDNVFCIQVLFDV